MLLEVGEENAAVLLARSALPDDIDLHRDADSLIEFGLDREQLDEVVRLTIGAVQDDDEEAHGRRDAMGQVVSRRCSDLVDQWLAADES